ncbi:MAG TPA: hypothetical protein VLA88_02155 [Candidatus Saccharimonadales bacterium]|nr:hypothetical protein [Candidatus Saccharimonadales bacterium]
MNYRRAIILAGVAIIWMAIALTFSKTYLLFHLFLPPFIVLLYLPIYVEVCLGKLRKLNNLGKSLRIIFYTAWFLFAVFAFAWGWSGPQTTSISTEAFSLVSSSNAVQELWRLLMCATFWTSLILAVVIFLLVFNQNLLGQSEDKKRQSPKKIMSYMILPILNLHTIALPWACVLIMNPMIVVNSNTGGIGLGSLLLIPYMIFGLVVCIVNLVVAYKYLKRTRQKNGIAIVGCVIFVVGSMAYLGLAAWYAYTSFSSGRERNRIVGKAEVTSLINDCQINSVMVNGNEISIWRRDNSNAEAFKTTITRKVEGISFDDLRVTARNAYVKCGTVGFTNNNSPSPRELSFDEASALLKQCKILGYFSPIRNDQLSYIGDPERIETGIVSEHRDPPTSLFIAERMAARLLPVAQDAKKTCPDLFLVINGEHEKLELTRH